MKREISQSECLKESRHEAPHPTPTLSLLCNVKSQTPEFFDLVVSHLLFSVLSVRSKLLPKLLMGDPRKKISLLYMLCSFIFVIIFCPSIHLLPLTRSRVMWATAWTVMPRPASTQTFPLLGGSRGAARPAERPQPVLGLTLGLLSSGWGGAAAVLWVTELLLLSLNEHPPPPLPCRGNSFQQIVLKIPFCRSWPKVHDLRWGCNKSGLCFTGSWWKGLWRKGCTLGLSVFQGFLLKVDFSFVCSAGTLTHTARRVRWF